MTIDDLAVIVKGEFEKMDEKFDKVDKRFENIDKRFDGIDKRFDKIESSMVTKDYLDEKLADLRGDLVVLMRKEDAKLKTLVEILRKNKIISDQESTQVLAMEPFPMLSINK